MLPHSAAQPFLGVVHPLAQAKSPKGPRGINTSSLRLDYTMFGMNKPLPFRTACDPDCGRREKGRGYSDRQHALSSRLMDLMSAFG